MKRKVYVSVQAIMNPLERYPTPLRFVWEDGRTFEVDKILDVRKAASMDAGGLGIRYTIVVLGKETYLFYDEPEKKWFMEGK